MKCLTCKGIEPYKDNGLIEKIDNIFEARVKLKEGDYAHAIMLLEDLALNRNAEAFYRLGQCYAFSLGVPYCPFIAHDCYSMAKKLGLTKFYNTCSCLPIFFLIDTSDSMTDAKSALNELMKNLIMELQQITKISFWANFKIQAIAFSDTARCYHDSGIVDVDEFDWKTPEIGGKADYENMWNTLNDKLLALQKNNCITREPLFILISNGVIPDNIEGNASIRQNKIFSPSNIITRKFSREDLQSPEGLTISYTIEGRFFNGQGQLGDKLVHNQSFAHILWDYYMPYGYPEWDERKVSDSMEDEDIDNEIKELINYIRE